MPPVMATILRAGLSATNGARDAILAMEAVTKSPHTKHRVSFIHFGKHEIKPAA